VLFALTCLAGWALHTFVEEPMMRRFGRGRKERQELAARAAARPEPVGSVPLS
jgi:peptidoglycan/LPS O-acetylase OafA/YrhL